FNPLGNMDALTTPVRQQHKFNVSKLLTYLSGKSLVSNNDTLTVRQYSFPVKRAIGRYCNVFLLTRCPFSTGQSNPTFLIQTPSNSFVLRKKPPGELLPGAHKVDREYRVQKALFPTGFPVPQPFLHCTDSEVIGTEFYLMEHVKGRIFSDQRLPGVSPAERTALYVAAVEVLAKLHSLDLASLSLEGYGKGSGYCKRQVSTWTKQYNAAAHRDIPAMNELSDWLMKNLPASDNEVTLVHGDFRFDNLIFHPTEARVIAVLDWELSTTGQPLADLAYFLMHHFWPTTFNVISTIGSLKGTEGIPTVADLISIYCQCRGIPSALPSLNFYLALSIFKMAGIAQVVCTHTYSHCIISCSLCVQVKAREAGLWNLFLPAVSGLSQLDYAYIAEETGHCLFAPEVFNCQAPDTGNMEVLHMFGSEEQKRKWLEPLLRGEIRSCFCMTEPDVASSDATNIECTLHRDGDNYIINGKKWWSTLVLNFFIRHGQHSMVLVPMDTPGVKLVRPLTVFGQDDAIHGGHFEVHFENVCVPVANIILGEGQGFEIAQGRLGPGRLHHCMRAVGLAELALELLCQRAASRRTFGKKLYQHGCGTELFPACRLMIEQTRLLTLHAARALDTLGSRAARKEIAMIKVAAARMACYVVDCAIQVHGGGGVSGDFPLAQMYSYARTLRIADGPDEVHLSSIARLELRDQLKKAQAKL
uniref:Acyl-CoA dehydrogenase family member 11 n=1 Tax=Dicentrarchus labrax TaxID=13489 RepID=A0A8C4EP63_DICLA